MTAAETTALVEIVLVTFLLGVVLGAWAVAHARYLAERQVRWEWRRRRIEAERRGA